MVNTPVCYSHYSSFPPSPNPFMRPLFSPLCTVSPAHTCLSITPPSFLQSLLPVSAVLFWFLHPSAQLTFSSITLMLDRLTFCLCFLSLLQSYYFFPTFPKLSSHHDPSPSLKFHPRLSSSISLSLYVSPSILPPTD